MVVGVLAFILVAWPGTIKSPKDVIKPRKAVSVKPRNMVADIIKGKFLWSVYGCKVLVDEIG